MALGPRDGDLPAAAGTGRRSTRTAPDLALASVQGSLRLGPGSTGPAGVMLVLESVAESAALRTNSGEHGVFSFVDVPPGAYRLSAYPDAPLQPVVRELEVESGVEQRIVLPLEARFALTIHVLDATPGRRGDNLAELAVPSARIVLRSKAAAEALRSRTFECDEFGAAHLEDLPAGDIKLRVEADGFAPFETELALDLEHYREDPRLRGHPLVLRLSATAAVISGIVRGPGGAPIPGALVLLGTRTRKGSGGFAPADHGSRGAESSARPHALTDTYGEFQLTALAGYVEQSLLVCPARPGMPLVFRRPLSADELAASDFVAVDLPRATPVNIRCTRADGTLGLGTVQVSDGIVTYDLEVDSEFFGVPGLARWNTLERSMGRLELALAPGSYEVLFTPYEGARGMKAFFVTVSDAGPLELLLPLEDG